MTSITNLRMLAAISAATIALCGAAIAAGTHSGGHHDEMAIGAPGEAAAVTRIIEVTMREAADGRMIFEPTAIAVARGETIRLALRNEGAVEHEFVMDGHEDIMKHKAQMEKFPEMIHDDPNAVRLAPGEAGEIVWTFANPGAFTFACLIPGHFDAGMHGALTVNEAEGTPE